MCLGRPVQARLNLRVCVEIDECLCSYLFLWLDYYFAYVFIGKRLRPGFPAAIVVNDYGALYRVKCRVRARQERIIQSRLHTVYLGKKRIECCLVVITTVDIQAKIP